MLSKTDRPQVQQVLRRLMVASLLVMAVVAVAGCGSSTSASKPKITCLTNAPGKLCGSDAVAFCKTLKTGQSVSSQQIDPTTLEQCAKDGVGLNGVSAQQALGLASGLSFVKNFSKTVKDINVSGIAIEFQQWVDGQFHGTGLGKSESAPTSKLSPSARQAAALVVLRQALKWSISGQLPPKVQGKDVVDWLRGQGVD